MATSWPDVDKLVHELGSLRAVVEEIEGQADLEGDPVVAELRSLLDRAADTVHLVVGGDEAMVARAWKCIAEAQALRERVFRAVRAARNTQRDARSIAEQTRAIAEAGRATRRRADATIAQAEQRVSGLKQERKSREARMSQSDPRPKG